MAEEMSADIVNDAEGGASASRVYEIGYHVVPTVKEEDLEKTIGTIRAQIEKAGGNFIAEGAPSLTRLSYGIEGKEGDKRVEYDRAYFGWIKFEAAVERVHALDEGLKANPEVARFIVFRTVREDTRAKMKAPTLREIKRTDTIKSTPRRTEEASGPVSEEDLEKALQDITAE
ncbi:30S ribosomal protein S6 [Candidatus Kaiserbacteria bacterium]|nr:30S ribosomal protein S6 [Candidatus Kaiserbacteria bacterium]